MIETTYLTNHFLIAMPNLGDPNFFHTVTYVCMHNEEGAMGIIINRPTNVELGDILKHMGIDTKENKITKLSVYDGGPVQRERGFVIHRPVGNWEAMLTLDENIAITTSRDILTAIAHDDGPDEVLVALGYAGWSAGQLEKELVDNAWLSIPADADIIFNTPFNRRWQAAADRLGVDLTLLSSEAGHG